MGDDTEFRFPSDGQNIGQKIDGNMFIFAYRKGGAKKTHPEDQLSEENIGPKDSMVKKVSQHDLAEGKQDHRCEQDDEKTSFYFFQ
jgi:hypothetical protein